MRRASILIAALFALAASAAGARTNATSPCALVKGKDAASLGVNASCVSSTLNGPGLTSAIGRWGRPGSTSTALSLVVNTYPSASGPSWQVAMQTLSKLPGKATKVSGIGSVAYESGGDGSTVASIHFVVGKHIVSFSWYASKAPASLKAFNAVARSIAGRL